MKELAKGWSGTYHTPDSHGFTFYERLWPRLKLISCWADASARLTLPRLKQSFPNAEIEPKGLLATEAFVSFPWHDGTSALSINSHFFEFLEEDGLKIRLAHELLCGKRYSVIITTSGGLYRYELGDLIEVVGFVRECPLIRFIGRTNKVVDLAGEKLSEGFIEKTSTKVFANIAKFWMLAPAGARGYIMFLQPRDPLGEEKLRTLARRFESELRTNYHYNYARDLNQLDNVKLFLIDKAEEPEKRFLERCRQNGQRLGDIKPAFLHPTSDWEQIFKGKVFSWLS